MKNKGLILSFWVGLIVLGFLTPVFAQPEAAPAAGDEPTAAEGTETAAEEETMQYAYGTVVSAAADQLTIKEYDYDADQEVEVVYKVENPKLLNVNSLQELAVGDSVEIFFEEKDGNKIAVQIVKETLEEEEADIEEEEGVEAVEPEAPATTE